MLHKNFAESVVMYLWILKDAASYHFNTQQTSLKVMGLHFCFVFRRGKCTIFR